MGIGEGYSGESMDNIRADDLNKTFASWSPTSNVTDIPLWNDAIDSPGQFGFVLVEEHTVSQSILIISSNAAGSDGLSVKFLKIILLKLLPHLTHLFNTIISTGNYPFQWKLANVIPIPKVNNPSKLSDFRPISLLPILSKAFESLIKDQISITSFAWILFLNISRVLELHIVRLLP